jgi:hypothetical protein
MAKQQLIKEAFKLQQIAGIKPLYEFEIHEEESEIKPGDKVQRAKGMNNNDHYYVVDSIGDDGYADVTIQVGHQKGLSQSFPVKSLKLFKKELAEGMDSGDELVDILLGHVKDIDQAERYASMDPEMWPEWLEASLNRDPKYTEFAMDKIQEADDDDDAEDMEDSWNKVDSDDDYDQEPTKKDIQVGDKMVGVLGGNQSRLQTLMGQKDAILSKFKSGQISIDQYKQEIGNIPQQIKNLQAAIEKQMSGGEEGEDEMLNESEIHYFYKTDRYGSRVCHAKDDEGNVWKVDDSKCRRVGTYNNQRDEVKKESVLGKYIRQEVVRTLKENQGVEGKQKHNYPKDRFKNDEEYEKFLDDTLKKLMDKITNDPKLIGVFKRMKDK